MNSNSVTDHNQENEETRIQFSQNIFSFPRFTQYLVRKYGYHRQVKK